MSDGNLTKKLRETLRSYADTSDGRFHQDEPGATALMVMGMLEFRGEQYGSRFFSITDKGRAALAPTQEGDGTP